MTLNKKIVKYAPGLAVACLLCVLLLVYVIKELNCGFVNTPANPQERLEGIPLSAVWAGGTDGGAWISCTLIKNIRVKCIVYNEYTGEVDAEGEFIAVSRNSEKAKNFKISNRYSYYDGMNIGVDDNITLMPDGWVMYRSVGIKYKYDKGKKISDKIPMTKSD